MSRLQFINIINNSSQDNQNFCSKQWPNLIAWILISEQCEVCDIKCDKIANPPIVGIGTLLTRLAFGLSTAPIFSASPRIKGVKASDSKNVAAIDASILYICRPLSVSSLCANTADSAQQICKHESLQVQNTFYHKSKTNKRRGPKS